MMEDQQPENLANALKNLATAMTTDEVGQPFSVGAALRDARVQSGMTVEDVSARIKFAPRQIEALEADDFKNLPEPAFVRGFIRSYARVVQLDAAELIARMPNAAPAPVTVEQSQEFESVPFSGTPVVRRKGVLGAAVVLGLAVLVGIFMLFLGDDEEEAPQDELALHVALPAPVVSAPVAASAPAAVSAPLAVSTPVVVSAVASAPVAVMTESPLRLIFDESSWVEAKDASGKVLLSQNNPGGTEQRLEGVAPFALVIGRASHVRLSYKGQFVDLTPYTVNDVARLKLEK